MPPPILVADRRGKLFDKSDTDDEADRQRNSESLSDIVGMHKRSDTHPIQDQKPKEAAKRRYNILYATAVVAAGAAIYSLFHRVEERDWETRVRQLRQENAARERQAGRQTGPEKQQQQQREQAPEEDFEERRVDDRFENGMLRREILTRRVSTWHDDRDRQRPASRSPDESVAYYNRDRAPDVGGSRPRADSYRQAVGGDARRERYDLAYDADRSSYARNPLPYRVYR